MPREKSMLQGQTEEIGATGGEEVEMSYMAKEKKKIEEVEAFVRKVLQENFNQNVDSETLRTVAKKVSRAIAIPCNVLSKDESATNAPNAKSQAPLIQRGK